MKIEDAIKLLDFYFESNIFSFITKENLLYNILRRL